MQKTKLIVGTAQFVSGYGMSGRDLSSSAAEFGRILAAVETAGFAAIDTAPVYGVAESVVGQAQSSLQIHTKFDPHFSPETSIGRSLRALRRSSIDVVYVHDKLKSESLVTSLPAFHDACALAGSSLGVSVYEVDEFQRAAEMDQVEYIQVPANAMDQRFTSDIVSKVRSAGKKVIGRSVFLQGALVAKSEALPARVGHLREYVVKFQEVCRRHEVSALEGALRFVLETGSFDGVIIGIGALGEALEILDSLPSGESKVEFTEELRSLECPQWDMVDPRRW